MTDGLVMSNIWCSHGHGGNSGEDDEDLEEDDCKYSVRRGF